MNQKVALIKALLAGEVLSIKTAFELTGCSNFPREASRQIEKPYGVVLSRVEKLSKTRYGTTCRYFEYRLNKSEHNLPGIKAMKEYVKKHTK